jgi:acyl carrier protein
MIEKEIRKFIIENFLFGKDNGELADHDSLLEKGIIDSTGVLELVQYLECTYSLQVKDEDLVPDNLDTIARAAAYVKRQREANPDIAG